MHQKSNPAALLPIVVFLILYLGNGIFFEYIHPLEGQMGFYIISVVVAFTVALAVALLQNRRISFDEKIHLCAKEAGGASSTANLLLSIIPAQFAIPGLFIIACLISMAMGTSVGTISVLVPIAAAVSESGGLHLPLCVATVVGGSMFGDNLSFISDTTIAATNTQGVQMKDKFRTNLMIALPAAVLTLIILIIYAVTHKAAAIGDYPYVLPQALPYFVVLALAIIGINVFVVLGIGIFLFLAVGFMTGSLTYVTMFAALGGGTSGMYETMIVTILVASIGALIKANGGFTAILEFIQKHFHGARGGMFGIGLLTILMDIATANNTVAIVMAAPIAKHISTEYRIDPKQTASLLDTCSCIAQGIIPYGAQLLIAAGLCGLSSVNIIPYLFYPYLLGVFVVLSIVFRGDKYTLK